jgi:predicted RNA-binding Zn-ribbon protein involved in translation (DUF1610 family)
MPKGIYEHTKQGRYGLRRINGKDVENWITLPNGKHVVLGKGEITDYNFPYTHKNKYTNDEGMTFNPGEYEMINLYEYLNSAKRQKQKEELAKENEDENEMYSYSCPDCGNKIKKSDKRCSNCKVIIDWE